MTPPGVLADPRVRLAAGTAALLVTAMAARGNRVGPGEAAAFRAINDLPGWLYPPAWAVMQLGALGAAPAAAGAAWLAGDRELAGRLLAGGTSAWALSKVAKRLVQRPRPAGLLPGTRRRGRDAVGLGYLSGHAGVAVVLGATALPRLGPGGRALTLAAVPVVGLTRIYVGAHLPLDVAGGAALGLIIDAAMALVSARTAGSAAAWPKDPGSGDLGPWPAPAAAGQRRTQHRSPGGAARPGRATCGLAQRRARWHYTQLTTRDSRYCLSTGACSC